MSSIRTLLGMSLLLALSMSPLPSFAQGAVSRDESSEVQERLGRIVCNSIPSCRYTATKTTPDRLISLVTEILFDGIPLHGPSSKGKLFRSGDSDQIIFWHKEPEMLEKMKLTLAEFDQNDDFEQRDYVEITVEALQANEAGYNSFGAEIGGFNKVAGGTDKAFGATSAAGGGMTFNIPIGAGLLNATVKAGVEAQQLKRVETFSNTVKNMQSLNAEFSEPTYKSLQGSLNSKDGQKGTRISGVVSIDRNSARISIRGFNFRLGLPSADPNIPKTFTVSQDLIIPTGTGHIIAGATSALTVRKRNLGLFSVGSQKSEETAYIIVIVKARVIPFKEYEARPSAELTGQPAAPEFRKEEIDLLNVKNQTIALSQVFQSLEPVAEQLDGGQILLGVKLNPDLATAENFKKRIRVQVRGPGVKADDYRELQNLMLGVYRLPELSSGARQKAKVDFRLTLSEHSSSGEKSASDYSVRMEYIPDTNKLYILK